jgi:uncharacterized Zn finger protein
MMKNFKITKKAISDNFDNGAYSRGFRYYTEQRVVSYDIYSESDKITIHSKVEGTEIYEQEIELSNFDDLYIESDCSCPVGYNCKHAVAVLFQLLSNTMSQSSTSKPQDQAKMWLDEFMQVHQQNKVDEL